MDLELTISGLWLMVLKAKEPYPRHPDAVDVVIPDAHHHRPVLSYFPEDVAADIEPAMAIDATGRRIAAADLCGKAITIECRNSPVTEFSVGWAAPSESLPPPADVLNWVPSIADVGFGPLTLGAAGSLPAGASARVSLPMGELTSRNVVKDAATGGSALWAFPKAGGIERAVANEVVLTVRGCTDVIVWRGAERLLRSTLSAGAFRLSVSNDLSHVPADYNAGVKKLDHLEHLEVLLPLDPPPFDPPTLVELQRTGKPICNGVRFVDMS